MLDDRYVELSKMRMQKSNKNYITAKNNLKSFDYDAANNRAYYSIFHAIRALLALDGMDFKKHSQVIGYINKFYIHSGLIEQRCFEMITGALDSRNKSDYNDYYVADLNEAENNVNNAGVFLRILQKFISDRIESS